MWLLKRKEPPSFDSYPFEAYVWPDAKKDEPVGRDATEAARVGWAMTLAAHIGASKIIPLCNAVNYATHLERERNAAQDLYLQLSGDPGNASLCVVEKSMRHTIQEIDVVIDGQSRRVDPYCSKHVHQVIEESLCEHILQLDASLTLLPGLDSTQHGGVVSDAMAVLRRNVSKTLTSMLMDRTKTTVDLVQKLTTMASDVTKKHVDLLKPKLQADCRCVKVILQLLDAQSVEKKNEIFNQHDVDLSSFFCNPPLLFDNVLKKSGVRLDELTIVMKRLASSASMMASVIPPAPMSIVFSMLQRWLQTHHRSVREACMHVYCALVQTIDDSHSSKAWCGVAIELNPDDGVDKQPWPVPLHLAFSDRSLVCTKPVFSAVRACRLFSILIEEAQLGLLPIFTIRASALAAIVSRIISDKELSYSQLFECTFRSFDNLHRWPVSGRKRQRRRYCRPASPASSVSSDASALSAILVTRCKKAATTTTEIRTTICRQQQPSAVPLKLRRDHAVLSALYEVVLRHQSSSNHHYQIMLSVDEVARATNLMWSEFHTKSSQSVQQTVAHVLKTAVLKCRESNQERINSDDVEYSHVRETISLKKCSGIKCSKRGFTVLENFLATTLWQMRYNGLMFSDKWLGKSAKHAQKASRKL
jgi:hypothetical protein